MSDHYFNVDKMRQRELLPKLKRLGFGPRVTLSGDGDKADAWIRWMDSVGFEIVPGGGLSLDWGILFTRYKLVTAEREVVHKINTRLGREWARFMRSVLKWDAGQRVPILGHVREAKVGYYSSDVIRGFNLRGEYTTLKPQRDQKPPVINYRGVRKVLLPLEKMQKDTGLRFADLSLGNIMGDGEKYYLIDFDSLCGVLN